MFYFKVRSSLFVCFLAFISFRGQLKFLRLKCTQIFLFPSVLPLIHFFFTMYKTGESNLIDLGVHLYVKSDVLFSWVTHIRGLREVTIAEFSY